MQDLGNILDGSLYEKYFKCGKKNCKCFDEASKRHGPYWVWSRRVKGKIMQKQLNEKQLEQVKEGLANYKKLLKDIEKAKDVCERKILN